MFFTCAHGDYTELIPLYKYCVKRVYPAQEVVCLETENPSIKRFLLHQPSDYVHVTDIDILILPQKKTHEEYYLNHAYKGASYVGGVIKSKSGIWQGNDRRIACGELVFTQEYYEETLEMRKRYSSEPFPSYREADEVLLCRTLRHSGYPIPEEPYTFYDGTKWDKSYRDLHLGDFRGKLFKRWQPDRDKVRDLVNEPEFISICKSLSPKWLQLIQKVVSYSQGYDH